MHTISMEINNEFITVNFNSDWSGQALIVIGEQTITIPAALFVHVARIINNRALNEILEGL